MNPQELHHDETLSSPVRRPPLPVNMSKIKWPPNLDLPCWVLASEDSANSSVTKIRSIPRRQAVIPSAGLPDCLAFVRTCQMCHTALYSAPRFPPEDYCNPRVISLVPRCLRRSQCSTSEPATCRRFPCSGRRSLAVLEGCLCHESRSPVDRCPEQPAI